MAREHGSGIRTAELPERIKSQSAVLVERSRHHSCAPFAGGDVQRDERIAGEYNVAVGKVNTGACVKKRELALIFDDEPIDQLSPEPIHPMRDFLNAVLPSIETLERSRKYVERLG